MNYAQIAANARATLTKFGQSCRVRVYGEPVYNPTTSQTTRSETDSTVVGALFDFPHSLVLSSGMEVEKGDKRLYLAADTVVTPGDCSILIDSVEYQVIGVGEINPAGTVVLYDLHLRR